MTTPKQNPDGEAVVETREMDMSRDRNTPPTEWLENVVTIDARVGIYAWPSPDSTSGTPTIWHWCATEGRWCAWGTRNHTLAGSEPLHLEPSLAYPCCGLHGWIRDGKWVSV